MKSGIITTLVAAAGGFVSGIVVGFYGTRKIMEKQINRIVKEELDKYIEANGEKTTPPAPYKVADNVTVIPVKELEREEVADPIELSKEEKKQSEEIIRSEGYTSNTVKEAPEDMPNKTGVNVHLVGPFRDGTVFIIDEDEYDDSPHYTKTAVTYYPATDTFYDDGDEVIDPADVPGLLGSNILDNFGVLCDDPDIVHVRNTNRNLNIEVARMHGYHDD